MKSFERHGSGLAETLTMTCPACLSDRADTLGVTGYMDGRLESTVVMVCLACESVYLSPAPHTEMQDRRSEFVEAAVQSVVGGKKAGVDAGKSVLVCEYSEARLLAHEPAKHAYDVILLLLSLESSTDIRMLLRQAAKLLSPGGHIDVVISNTRSSCFGTFAGRHWYAYDYPRTRQFVSLQGLAAIAGHAGLQIVSKRTQTAMLGWLFSTRNWLSDWGRGPLMRFLLAGAWGGPWIVCATLEFIAGLRGRGALLTARLEKTA